MTNRHTDALVVTSYIRTQRTAVAAVPATGAKDITSTADRIPRIFFNAFLQSQRCCEVWLDPGSDMRMFPQESCSGASLVAFVGMPKLNAQVLSYRIARHTVR